MCVLSFAQISLAYPRWNVNFNSMTTGVTPQIGSAVAGQVNTKPTDVNVGAGNSILVQDNFPSGGDTLAAKPVVFSKPNAEPNDFMRLYFAGPLSDYEAGKDFLLEFDLLIPGPPPADANTIFSVNLVSPYTSREIGVLAFRIGERLKAQMLSFDPINPSVVKDINDGWSLDKVMHIKVGYSGTYGKFVSWVDGVLIGAINVAPDPNHRGVKDFYFGNGSSRAITNFAIDNITTSGSTKYYGQRPPIGLWNVTFDSMTADAKPTTYLDNYDPPSMYIPKPGMIGTMPSSIWIQDEEIGSPDTVLVRNNFTVGTTTMPGNSLEISHDPSGDPHTTSVTFNSNPDDYNSPKSYKLTLDMLVKDVNSQQKGSLMSVILMNSFTSTPLAMFTLGEDLRVYLATQSNYAGADRILEQYYYNKWQFGELMHIKLVLDALNKKFHAWINNSYIGHVDVIMKSPEGVAEPNLFGVKTIVFENSTYQNATVFAIDNLKSEYIEVPLDCTDIGFLGQTLPGDLNHDCYADWLDIKEFADKWLQSKLY